MRLWLRIMASLVAVLSFGLGLAFWLHADWRARVSIAGMTVREGNAFIAGKCPGDFGFNTFTNDTDHHAIEKIYASACRKLESMRLGRSLQSYYWQDDAEGWPGVTTVLQLPNGYFAVTAYCGNDSDGVTVQARPGIFSGPKPPGPKPMIKPLDSWKLPGEFLASEWGGR